MSAAPDPLARVRAARIPADALGVLAAARGADVRVVHDGADAWVAWEDAPGVLETLLPVPGCALFDRGPSGYARHGSRLPLGPSPLDREGVPLASCLVPAPVPVRDPGSFDAPPVTLRLVPAGEPRPATAALVPLAALDALAFVATTLELDSLEAVVSSEEALVRARPGRSPPLFTPGGLRLWGERVLAPLGSEVAPALPEATLVAALGGSPDELLLATPAGFDLIDRAAFAPLTRAAARLAARRSP